MYCLSRQVTKRLSVVDGLQALSVTWREGDGMGVTNAADPLAFDCGMRADCPSADAVEELPRFPGAGRAAANAHVAAIPSLRRQRGVARAVRRVEERAFPVDHAPRYAAEMDVRSSSASSGLSVSPQISDLRAKLAARSVVFSVRARRLAAHAQSRWRRALPGFIDERPRPRTEARLQGAPSQSGLLLSAKRPCIDGVADEDAVAVSREPFDGRAPGGRHPAFTGRSPPRLRDQIRRQLDGALGLLERDRGSRRR